jgi:RHS repeat-associated protein
VTWTPTAAEVGSQHVIVTAGEANGGETVQEYFVTVAASLTGATPAITSQPRTVVRIGRDYLYAVQASGTGSDALTYSLDAAPAGMTVDASGMVSWTPTAAQFGPNAVTLRVNDPQGGSAVQSFTVTVVSQDVNHPPTITSTPGDAATVGKLYQYNAAATDPEDDPVIWSLLQGPVGMSIDPMLGTIRWTPTTDEIGPQQVVIQAADPLRATTTKTFMVTVHSVDVPPAITSEPPTRAGAGVAYSYAVAAASPEGAALTYSLAAAPAGMTIDPASGSISWTPTAGELGTQDVTIRVDDGQGGSVEQSYQVVVSSTAPPRPPVITSSPIVAATIGQAYAYQVTADVPDGGPAAFSLLEAPAGMTIDPSTGTISWTPTAAEQGLDFVTVAAIDSSGLGGTQRYAVTVSAPVVPEITSTPVMTITAGQAYEYDVQAAESDGSSSPFTYSLSTGPAGMAIDPHGRLTWSPQVADIGTHHVVLAITDDHAATTTQAFDLRVIADTQAPVVTVFVNPTRVNVGSDVTFTVAATDNVKVAVLSLTVGGTPVALDAKGSATVTMTTAGLQNVVASATDPAGNVGTATQTVRVVDPADTQGPRIQITSPAADTVITSLTDIMGTITSTHLESYRVDYAPADQVDMNDLAGSTANFVTIAQGTAPVTDGKLATFDPTRLANDAYVVRVLAQDTSGNVSAAGVQLDVIDNLKLGRFTRQETDLSIPLAGITIGVTRVYDSLQADQQGDFGFAWRLDIADPQIHKTVPPNPSGSLFSNSTFKDGTRVYITSPSGQREGFTFTPILESASFFGIVWQPHFTPDPGVTDQLTVANDGLEKVGNSYRSFLFGYDYNPDEFMLTTKDGNVYRYNDNTGLESITTPGGVVVTFTAAGITSSTGQSITFLRDAQGRIGEIVDPAGNVLKYSYDASGNLATETNQIGETTSYQYLAMPAHYLAAVIDPMGHRTVGVTYDAQGRVTGTTDALGNTGQQSYDPAHLTEHQADPLGNVTTLVYDANGNIISRTDPLGNTTTSVFDANNNEIATTDARGYTTRRTFDARGNVTSITDPLGGVQRFTYDPTFNKVLTATDQLGHTITHIYDSQGNEIQTVDAAGFSSSMTYDNQGRALTSTDQARFTTQYVYGAGPNPEKIINPDGTSRTYQYNEFGETTLAVDENGQSTVTVYDGDGRAVLVRDAAGHETTFAYDSADRLVSLTDPDGNTTHYVYDAAGREIQQITAIGGITSYAYDAVGNEISTTDPDGQTRAFTYDADGHQTQETWLAGGTVVRQIHYAYDPAGNRVSASDPNSSYIYSYDPLNRLLTSDNAGTPGVQHVILTYGYDAVGNVTSVLDNQGVRVDSTYDVRNLLIERTWQGGGIDPARVDISYDSRGLVTEVDRFADLAVSRRIGRTLYDFSSRGMLTDLKYLDAVDAVLASYQDSYDPVGQLVSETYNGQVSTFTYDATGQLIHATHPGQPDEVFTYDPNGNRTGNNLVVGQDNQLLSDGTFNYTSDADGNLIRKTEIATGNVTSYAYDFLNRLTAVVERTSSGTVLHSTSYTYDVLGQQIGVTVDGQRTTTVYNGQHVWADFNASGTVMARYLTGTQLDQILARFRPGEGTVWYLADRQGSVRDLVNADGSRIDHIDYLAFGTVADQSNPAAGDRFLFTGRELDALTGLYDYRARYFDPESGRFISQDPISFGGGDSNLYRYLNNAPENAVDPLGQGEFAVYSFFSQRALTIATQIVRLQRLLAQGQRIRIVVIGTYGGLRGGTNGGIHTIEVIPERIEQLIRLLAETLVVH